ncbi:MAG: hypothetical protein VYE77_05995 [Planctomycetota bacterium]|nr:hypothetical protein [Planctomycetota bacterium]
MPGPEGRVINKLLIVAGVALVLWWFWTRARQPQESAESGRACPDCRLPLRQGPTDFEHAKATWVCVQCGYREHDLQ